MAVRAYPDPIPEAYPNGANQAAIDAVDARNAQALLFAQQEREHQIKRFFKKCMPSWLRAKLLEQPDNTAIEDLCLLARKQLTIHNLCKMDDYSDGAFNEVSSTITENLVNALSKITQTQEAMENKMNALAKQLDEKNQQRQEDSYQKTGHQPNRGYGRGNFRGNSRGNRGYRGQNGYCNNFYRGRGQNFSNNSFQQPSFSPAPTQASYQSTEQSPSADFSGQAPIQVIPPESSSHVATTQYAKVVCFKCGYPNHLANQCAL